MKEIMIQRSYWELLASYLTNTQICQYYFISYIEYINYETWVRKITH